ncbi:hypothetical protein Dsin_024314 [Dipteronia sinensis]|uniref:Uncharacterized protein n=1 Tax=Dipteronia sinensis TaxID=43782 RepID=A0AAD9ZUW5_9ROSI|nr:hypothetical protein Dsin_024314 [Dipteronia sinensis]
MAKSLVLISLCLDMAAVFRSVNAMVVPAIFISGDSIADVGTNNFLPGTLEAKPGLTFLSMGLIFRMEKLPVGSVMASTLLIHLVSTVLFLSVSFLSPKLMGHKRSPPPFISLDSASAVKMRASEV